MDVLRFRVTRKTLYTARILLPDGEIITLSSFSKGELLVHILNIKETWYKNRKDSQDLAA